MSNLISSNYCKSLLLNVDGKPYLFVKSHDRRWFHYDESKGIFKRTSGNYVKNMTRIFGDKSQRAEERFKRRGLFQALERKRKRQQQQQQQEETYDISDIRRYFSI